MDPKAPIIVVEDPPVHQIPLLKKYISQGALPQVFDWDFQIKSKPHLVPLLDHGQIERVYVSSLSPAHGQAIDLAKQLESWVKSAGDYTAVSKLYGDEAVAGLFLRGLAEEIFKFCYILAYLKERCQEDPAREIIFVCRHFYYWKSFLKETIAFDEPLPDQVRLVRDPWHDFWEVMLGIIYKSAAVIHCTQKIVAALLGGMTARPLAVKKSFVNAVMIGSRLEVERSGERGYDLIINGKDFNNLNTVFIDQCGLAGDLLARESSKGYTFFCIQKELAFGEVARLRWNLGFARALAVCLWKGSMNPGAPVVMARAYFLSVQKYCDWNLILQVLDMKNLIFTNQENIQVSAINLLLRNRGKSSWNYSCFLGGGYIMAKDNNLEAVRNVLWSFLIYDHFIGPNQDVIFYYQRHFQQVKAYHAVGSIFAEMISLKISSSAALTLKKRYFPSQDGIEHRKLIVIFDTTFIDSRRCLTNLEDGIHFYEDMWRLVNEEDMLFIFKPSKSPAFYCNPRLPGSSPQKGEQMLRVWRRLKKHPRVFWPISLEVTDKSFLDFSFNNDIIAAADAVITHCMSSPTAEALSAGKKAFWYETSDKHQGIDYDLYLGLVAHGYAQLREKLNMLLWMGEDAYRGYLHERVEGKIDEHLDGKGLSRFRQLLVNGIS